MLLPVLRQQRGIELQIGAVVTHEEVVHGVEAVDDGEQGGLGGALQEACVQAALHAGAPESIAENIVADGAGKGTEDAETRQHARHVPGRTAGLAGPLFGLAR